MTLDGMIEQLTNLRDNCDVPGSVPVRFAYDYGDHCHTIVCVEATEVVQAYTKHNSYVDEQVPVNEEEDADYMDIDGKTEQDDPDSLAQKVKTANCVIISNFTIQPWR